MSPACRNNLQAGVAQYNEKLERLSGNDDCGTIVERLKALDEQLSGIKAQEEGLRKQLSDIRARDDARNVDIPKLQQVIHISSADCMLTASACRQPPDGLFTPVPACLRSCPIARGKATSVWDVIGSNPFGMSF